MECNLKYVFIHFISYLLFSTIKELDVLLRLFPSAKKDSAPRNKLEKPK